MGNTIHGCGLYFLAIFCTREFDSVSYVFIPTRHMRDAHGKTVYP